MDFSVLMPVYIKEEPLYLNEALESILIHQTVLPTEVVIIQDGPITYDLKSIINKFSAMFPNCIRIFELEKNMGMGYAMNFGLKNCTYDWVFRMDSDDIARPNRFEKQIEIISTNQYDIVGSSISEFHSTISDLSQFRIMPKEHYDIVKMLKYRNPINHMTVAYNRKIALLAGGYWSDRFFEDYNLWYEMYKSNARFYNIQDILVDARIGNNMIERRSGYSYFLYELKLLRKFLKDGFINLIQFSVLVFLKFIIRLLPVSFISFFYRVFLRTRKK